MIRPSAYRVACPECFEPIMLPITQMLIIGNVASLFVDKTPLESHMVIHVAEKILEDA